MITLFRFFISNYSFWDKLSHECSGTDSPNFENCFSLLASVQSIIMKMTIIIIQEMTMGRTCSKWSLKKNVLIYLMLRRPLEADTITSSFSVYRWENEVWRLRTTWRSILVFVYFFPSNLPPYFLAALQGRQDNISPTRDWTCAPCSGSMVSQPLDHWGSPRSTLVERWHGIRRQASSSEHLIIARRYPGSPYSWTDT